MSEKYEKIKEQCRLRALKHYEKNKDKILEKRAMKRNIKSQSIINYVDFDLGVMTKNMQESTKIDNESTRKSHLNRIKSFFEIQKKEKLNLFDYQNIIDNITNSTYGKHDTIYKTSSKKNILESFLYCLDNFVTIEPAIREKYQDYYLSIKIIAIQELDDKKTNPENSVISWTEYEKRILEKFGIDSKQFLIIQIYKECLGRDDFDLWLINDLESINKDKTKNYLIIHDDDKYEICMQSYKTSKGKDPIFIELSCEVSFLINNYIKKNNIQERLFPTKQGKNSSWISQMNKRIDVDGSINTIRHIVISSFSQNMNAEELVQLSKRCFHSVSTQPFYKRQIDDKNKIK